MNDIEPTETCLTALYYTGNDLPEGFATAVQDILIENVSCPIICVSQAAIEPWADVHIVTGPLPRERASIYQQILRGLQEVKTSHVALCEHDVLYPPEYFTEAQLDAAFMYNRCQFYLHVDKGCVYGHRRGRGLSQLIAPVDLLRAEIEARMERPDLLYEKASFEPGKNNKSYGLAPANVIDWEASVPTVDINGHGHNLSGPRPLAGEALESLPYWGSAKELALSLEVPEIETTTEDISEPQIEEPVEEAVTKNGPVISVLIPARNEPFLAQTIQDLQKNLRLSYEILVGLDGPQSEAKHDAAAVEAITDPRVTVTASETSIGMRPTLNRLLAMAKGKYVLKCDAHCAIDDSMDMKLVSVLPKNGVAVARRYDLDTPSWKKRPASKTDIRRLTHPSEDGVGLRSLKWPERDAKYADEKIVETMTISGSCYLLKRSLWQHWGGWDEEHGHFGQEGAEVSLKAWLSGGQVIENKGTWYAHWNRGKATYSMGKGVKPQSMRRSHELWLKNQWPHQKYSVNYIFAKFNPPGWPPVTTEPHLRAPRMGSGRKRLRNATVEALWERRIGISEPGKVWRLELFWTAFGSFIHSVLEGEPDWTGPYYHYLRSHLRRGPMPEAIGPKQERHIRHKMADAARLTEDIRDNGLGAPLEFYKREDKRAILWKGYRRLVILHKLGITGEVTCRCYADRRFAEILSPQRHMARLKDLTGPIHAAAMRTFLRHGGRATDKYWSHDYCRHYDQHLAEIMKRVRAVCEIGAFRGASLALWHEVWPKAKIIGVDNKADRWKEFAGDLPNCDVCVGDERDQAFMSQVAARGPYDLIIDDGDHDPVIQWKAFKYMWGAVRPFGWYVIEDIWRSYNSERRCLPLDLMDFHQHRDIREIAWHYNIVFLQKAP